MDAVLFDVDETTEQLTRVSVVLQNHSSGDTAASGMIVVVTLRSHLPAVGLLLAQMQPRYGPLC